MCGIAGYISSVPIDHCSMLDSLVHRGPDMRGEYQQQVGEHQVYLGHRRLSIIDLSEAGSQPMMTPDKEIVLVYNGEVYNFRELRSQYLSDQPFHSRTDTEVILYLYQKLGPSFVELLNGDFAIAILDKRDQSLYLYRDRMGVKPLYYHFSEGQLFFASEIKPILSICPNQEIAYEHLIDYLVYKYSTGQKTLLRDIQRVQPGHMLCYRLEEQTLTERCYWQLKTKSEYASLSYQDARAEVRSVLQDASRIRLIADVPIGTFFSGGLDSSIIAYLIKDQTDITHYCAQKSREDLKKEGTGSDFDHALKLARQWELNLQPIPISSAEAELEMIRRTIYYSDDLIADGSQIPSYLITRSASHTSKVMLSGMGADEIFLGYPAHLMALLTRYFDYLPAWLGKKLSSRLAAMPQGRGAFKSYRRYLSKLGKYYPYPQIKYGIYSIVGDFENSLSILKASKEQGLAGLMSYFHADQDPLESQSRFEIENFLVKNLHYLDRMCMANSIEGRVPFMDHRVVELAFSLPRSYRLSALGKTKRVLKDSFSDALPAYIINRRKAGFGMPLRSIFSDPAKVNALLNYDFFGNWEYFDVQRIKQIVQNHINGSEDNSALIYALISYQEWYKMFVSKEIELPETQAV